MSNTIVRAENLGKKYVIGHQKEAQKYTALRDVITSKAISLGDYLNPFSNSSSDLSVEEEFWALKDVSFDICKGSRVGIIGRNGAGKSTLLKILSRITEPTLGLVEIKGKVASLLEVGTGFHPELTGRENVFLNGAVLGMSKTRIKQKFSEIVEFAEISRFIDVPVKRYSSGMYVRLAFSVAAHLEPDILVVDEVLAVGDMSFQKKCFGKMQDVAEQQRRTILFVSHNMLAIQKLCDQALLLENGTCKGKFKVQKAIDSYLLEEGKELSSSKIDCAILPRKAEFGISARISKVNLFNSKGRSTSSFCFGESFSLELECQARQNSKDLRYVVGIDSAVCGRITTLISDYSFSIKEGEVHKGILKVTDFCLNPSDYLLTVGLKSVDQLVHVCRFTIRDQILESSPLIQKEFNCFGIMQIAHATWILE